MRYTLREALAPCWKRSCSRPAALRDWWIEWPARRWRFWHTLLFAKGEGWLRWGMDERESGGYYEPPEPYVVAPPLRQLAIYLRMWLAAPKLMLRGVEWDDERYRFSWEEARPCWPHLDDPDRKGELWGEGWRYR